MNVTINKYKLKNQLNELLKADQEVTLDFQCGNDEAHVVPSVDGKMLEYGDLFFDLQELIIADLDLSSNGEIQVSGKGHLSLEDGDIYLEYSLEEFSHQWSADDKPTRKVSDAFKGSHLLLSKEYDDASKLRESLANSKREESKPDYLLTEKEFRSHLQEKDLITPEPETKKSKSWWKFW